MCDIAQTGSGADRKVKSCSDHRRWRHRGLDQGAAAGTAGPDKGGQVTHRSNKPVAWHGLALMLGARRYRRWLALVLAAGVSHGPAMAQFHVVPQASAEAAYDSNVFALSSREQAIAQSGDARRSDTVFRYTAGGNADYQWDIQNAFAAIEGRRIQYEHFDQLNHDEYMLTGGLIWHIGQAIDGTLDYRQERTMAAFADVQTLQLTMQRERKAGSTFNATVVPEWRVETGVHNRRLELPLPTAPDYALNENSADAAIKYIGVQKLSAGLHLEYLWGRYDGGASSDEFHQETAELTAKYVVSGLSNIGAGLGYTRRQGQAGTTESASGVTGSLSYSRRLSGKTSVDAELFRQVNSYVAGANAVVDTGARLGLFWQPTYKITAAVRYEWTDSAFQGAGGTGSNRRDHYQGVFMNLGYRPVRWLSIKPFVGYRDRHSSIEIDGYNDLTAGVLVQLRWGDLIGADDKSLQLPGASSR